MIRKCIDFDINKIRDLLKKVYGDTIIVDDKPDDEIIEYYISSIEYISLSKPNYENFVEKCKRKVEELNSEEGLYSYKLLYPATAPGLWSQDDKRMLIECTKPVDCNAYTAMFPEAYENISKTLTDEEIIDIMFKNLKEEMDKEYLGPNVIMVKENKDT